MTKAEILADLAAYDFVAKVWPGQAEGPINVDGTDNLVEYRVKYAINAGKAALVLLQRIYVLNDGAGAPTEKAFYHEKSPANLAQGRAIREWVLAQKSSNPDNFRGLTVVWVSDTFEELIYSKLVAGVAKYYHTVKNGATTDLSASMTEAQLSQYLDFLQANQVVV